MTTIDKLLILPAMMTLIGLIVWLIQSNFNDIKKSLEAINAKIVGKEVCAERHRAVEEKLAAHAKSINQLYDITRGDAVREED